MNVFSKLLVVGFFCLGGALAHAQNVHGVLRVVKGDVQIKSAKTGQTVRARLGEQVFPKDVVITGKDARAKIVMVDNNEINVSPESQIEIQHYEYDPAQGKKDVLLNVIYGKVRSKVEQKYDGRTSKFQVKTPSAVAGVRGTDFLTSYNRVDHSSQVVTFRGAVVFGLPGANGAITNAVSITPGKMAFVTKGAPPSTPTAMPKDQFARMDNDTKADAGPSAPNGKSDRAPSNNNGDQKDDGAKKGSSNSNSSSSSGSSAANSSTPTRSPASDINAPPAPTAGGPAPTGPGTGPSMLDPGRDLPQGTNTFKGPDLGPTLPAVPPPVPQVTQPNVCDTCKNLLQNGKTNLTVHLSH